MPITGLRLEPQGEDRQDDVLGYNIDFDQRFDDKTGKPIGRPMLTSMTIRITRSSEEDVPFYLQWQLEPTQTATLDLCFYDHDTISRKITIEDAYLVSYNQDCNEPGRIEETLIISPQRMTLEGELYDRSEYQ
ncbi:MAG: type VI secretion system tube protein TssD [Bacteroidota bacterium]